MKILLDVHENRAEYVLDVLKDMPFVKIDLLSPSKARFLKELKESINDVKLQREGKLKLKTAQELLDEL